MAHRLLPAAVAGLLLALAGCRSAPVLPPPTAPKPAPPPTVVAEDVEAELRPLLDSAQRAIDEDRLLTPEAHSAYRYLQLASEVAPQHAGVALGFERIVERYLQLAAGAIEQSRWPQARTMLDRARVVDGAHPGIEPLYRKIELLSSARRLTLALDHVKVRGRHAEAASKLVAFGFQARQQGARVTIRAGSDADARWIYDQLNSAPGGRRVRGDVQIGLPPRVEVLFLPPPSAED